MLHRSANRSGKLQLEEGTMAQKKRIKNPMASMVRSTTYRPQVLPDKKKISKHLRKQKKVWAKIIKEDLI